jgi:hypothetical protein
MKKKIILKESQLIDMIEKIVKKTQSQNLKEAEAKKGVQSNANGKKAGDKKAVPFDKPKSGKGDMNKVGKSVPSSVSIKKGPAGGSKPNNSERGAAAPKKGKLAKQDPTPSAPLSMKKVGKPKGRV